MGKGLTKAQIRKLEEEMRQAENMSEHYALQAKAIRIKLSRTALKDHPHV